MIGSDDDQFQEINGNQSLNETANSIHEANIDQDKEMAALDPILFKFIEEELKLTFKLDDLEHQPIFKEKSYLTINPKPTLYFMPHHIIIFNKLLKIEDVRDRIDNLHQNYYYNTLHRKSQELVVKVHSSSQLVFYNIRVLRSDEKLHQMKELLDQKVLIDKLFQYYSVYYQKLYFQETSALILYWAFQKDLIDQQLNEHIIKLLIICNFINFGYGVPNVIYQHMNNKQKTKEYNKMYSFAKINQKGETQIDQELIMKYTNYTVQQKRGFYMPSKKRFMNIKDILPIFFPLVPLDQAKHKQQMMEAKKNISAVLNNERERMSICKNIRKVFKFLHNKFQKRMRLVVDFQQTLAYREQYSQNFELQIIHPVLSSSISKIDNYSIRKLKAEINSIYDAFHQNMQPIAIMKAMMSKVRK